MEFAQNEVALAIEYAKQAEFKAYLSPANGEIQFTRSPLPQGLSTAMQEEIEFVAAYFQRQIFQGDLDPEPNEIPQDWPTFHTALEEINYKLKRFHAEFVLELKKSLGVQEPRQMNPYAQEMLKHSIEVKRTRKE